MVLLIVSVVLLAGVVAALAMGRIGAGMSVAMPPPTRTTGHDVFSPEIVHGELTRGDLVAARFDRAARGYRMDQVDAVLDRLGAELEARDERIAALSATTTAAPASSWGADPAPTRAPEPPEDGRADRREAMPTQGQAHPPQPAVPPASPEDRPPHAEASDVADTRDSLDGDRPGATS